MSFKLQINFSTHLKIRLFDKTLCFLQLIFVQNIKIKVIKVLSIIMCTCVKVQINLKLMEKSVFVLSFTEVKLKQQ